MRVRWYLLLPAFFLSAIRPADLEEPKGCTLWKGTASGNDPTVQVQLTLCTQENNAVAGVLQWSSERSGWNQRAVSGAQKNQAITLHDEKFLENKPNPGWRFCLVDDYTLTQNKDVLSGRYTSSACDDQATLALTLQPPK